MNPGYMVVKVVLPLRLEALSFVCHQQHPNPVGFRVVVPWQNELRIGVVVGLDHSGTHSYTLKATLGYLEQKPWLSAGQLASLQAIAQACCCELGAAFKEICPCTEEDLDHLVRAAPGTPPTLAGEPLQHWRPYQSHNAQLLEELRSGGLLEEQVRRKLKTSSVLVCSQKPGTPTGKGSVVLQWLQDFGQASSQAELAKHSGVSTGVVARLLREGWITLEFNERQPLPPVASASSYLPQAAPLSSAHGGRSSQRVAHLARMLRDKRCLVIFPDVGLLNQYAPYLHGCYSFYGQQTPEQRRQLWQHLAQHPASVLTTPQGVLLGQNWDAIVVVEDGSGHYHAHGGTRGWLPRMAQVRSQTESIPLQVVSGVATLEAFSGAMVPPPTWLTASAPRLHLVDAHQARGWPLCGPTVAVLQQTLEKNRQAMVLVSRKGYSRVLRCKQCSWHSQCPNCWVTPRYHQNGRYGLLKCHHCGHQEPAPSQCPNCQGLVFEPQGPGLEWVWENLKSYFSADVLYRYTAEDKDNLQQLEGKPAIVVGTTALLRAPTLPQLATVVLPWGDGFFQEPDYRASERYHRLLRQLSDIHPTHNPLLVVQTYEPLHPVHQAVAHNTPLELLQQELNMRQALHYPPYSRLIKLEILHSKEAVAREQALLLAERLLQHVAADTVLGPAPAPLMKVRGQFVFHILLKLPTTEALPTWLQQIAQGRGVKVRLETDPGGFTGLLDD